MHIWKVLIDDYQLKKTRLKNIEVEANDVIFKMAEFSKFTAKKQKISRTAYPILTIYTFFFQRQITPYSMKALILIVKGTQKSIL